jgi:hypothetical protein
LPYSNGLTRTLLKTSIRLDYGKITNLTEVLLEWEPRCWLSTKGIMTVLTPMLVKLSHGRTLDGAIRKMQALKEFRMRGKQTNIHFLQNVIQTNVLEKENHGKLCMEHLCLYLTLQRQNFKSGGVPKQKLVNGNSDVR